MIGDPYRDGRLDGGVGERHRAHRWPPGSPGHEVYEQTYRRYYVDPASGSAAFHRALDAMRESGSAAPVIPVARSSRNPNDEPPEG
jgi:hypothetical protein